MRHISPLGRDVSWFVVTKWSTQTGEPVGKCLIGLWTLFHRYIPESAHFIADEDVPNEVWAALAKWRLLNGADQPD